ncbi:MAG: Ig-like domain-containing protein, partial [bacterium]
GGTATFSGLAAPTLAQTGLKLTFTANGLANAVDTTSITVSAAAANKLVMKTAPSSSVAAGATFGTQPAVYVEDQYGNVLTGDNGTVVTATVGTGTGPLTGTLTATASGGTATFSGLAAPTLAQTGLQLTFTADSLSSAVDTTSITVSAAAANKLVFTTQPSASTVAGVAFATQPVVTIEDQYGNTVTSGADSMVSVALTLTSGTGSLGGAASMNAVAGVANFAGKGLSIDLVGANKVLTATATVVAGQKTTTTSPAFTITQGTTSVAAWPTAATITNNQSLAYATLSGGSATNTAGGPVPGAFTYDLPTSTVPGAGSTNMAVTFTPSDTNSYTTVAGGWVHINRFPVAKPNSAGTRQGQSVSISVGKLLANDTDMDGDTLAVTNVLSPSANSGTVVLTNNVVTYNSGYSGTDTFSYVICDVYGAMATGTVTVVVTSVTSGPVSLNPVGGIETTNGFFVVHFAGVPGYTYTVEGTDSLNPGEIDWQPSGENKIAPVTNEGWGIGIFEFSEPIGAASRYFRTVWPAYSH